MFNDPISDFLTRIRNAQAARHETMQVPGSRLKLAVAKILEREGYVGAVDMTNESGKMTISIALKYNDKQPQIRALTRVSTPGRRVYKKYTELRPVLSGQGIAILSTSAGVMTNLEARKRKLGGELLCEIY